MSGDHRSGSYFSVAPVVVRNPEMKSRKNRSTSEDIYNTCLFEDTTSNDDVRDVILYIDCETDYYYFTPVVRVIYQMMASRPVLSFDIMFIREFAQSMI